MRRAVLALAIAVTAASDTAAQRRDTITIPLPGPGMIHGFVADSLERPLEGAEVLINPLRLTVLTGPDGSFRFANLKPGKYQLTARKIGYYPSGRSVQVGDRGGATAFFLARRDGNVVLPPVVSSARRGGLSGVIGDTAYNAIPGANVWVLASDKRAQSDSTGAFYMDLKPGRYMIRVERQHFGSQLLSVTVPKDSGRRVMVWMSAADRGATARQNHAMLQASMRLTRRNPVWSKIYTREDITRSGLSQLGQIAQAGAGHPLDPDCMVVIDGDTARREPLWAIDAADLESVEVYTARPARRTPTSIMGGGGGRAPAGVGRPPRCAQVFAWMRR